jgi:hypothetical protein
MKTVLASTNGVKHGNAPADRPVPADLDRQLAEVAAELRRARGAKVIAKLAKRDAHTRQRRALRQLGDLLHRSGNR